MTFSAPTATEHDLTAYTRTAKLVAATSVSSGRISGEGGSDLRRSYTGMPTPELASAPWPMRLVETAWSDAVQFFIGPARPEDALIGQIEAFRSLSEGWDGENAAPPLSTAIWDAVRFVRIAGSLATGLEPTLHVDGSVILEIGNGAEGCLQFMGGEQVVFATDAGGSGVVTFDGLTIPGEIKRALGA